MTMKQRAIVEDALHWERQAQLNEAAWETPEARRLMAAHEEDQELSMLCGGRSKTAPFFQENVNAQFAASFREAVAYWRTTRVHEVLADRLARETGIGWSKVRAWLAFEIVRAERLRGID